MKATVLKKNYLQLDHSLVVFCEESKDFQVGDVLEINHIRKEDEEDIVEIIGLYETN